MRVVDDLAGIGRDTWNSLVQADAGANVFLEYDFLHALQASGCAVPRTGWTARHLTLWRDGILQAAVPLYEKTHSYGEYVFDWAWADAYRRCGLRYYPKWLSAVPFTPVPGARLLARDALAEERLTADMVAAAEAEQASSLHVLFAPERQIEGLAARGLLVRHGLQFHWRNAGYGSFDEFLAALAQPKRKKIRAERRKVAEAGVRLVRKTGDRIEEADWAFFFRCYCATYAAHGSVPYLNLAFFRQIGHSLPGKIVMVLALRDDRPLAAGLGLFDAPQPGRDGRLYGRYWGTLADVSCLHFEVCYYQMIEFAIERGLAAFEGGAQGAHKLARGLDPVATRSAHWIADPVLRTAIAAHVRREAEGVAEALDELNEHRAFKAPADLREPEQ
jgi:hypothetical protein